MVQPYPSTKTKKTFLSFSVKTKIKKQKFKKKQYTTFNTKNNNLMSKLIFLFLFISSLLIAQNNSDITLAPVKVNYKWGFIDKTGELKIPAQFDFVENFDKNGLCVVEINKKLGIIDKNGNLNIPCDYEMVKVIDSQTVYTKTNEKWQLRNIKNDLLVNDIGGRITPLGKGFIEYEKEGKVGLAHIHKGKIINPDYLFIRFLPDSSLLIYQNFEHKKGLADFEGNIIFPAMFDSFIVSKNAVAAAVDQNWSLYNKNGNLLTDDKFAYVEFPYDELAVVNKDSQKHIFSLVSNKIIYKNFKEAYLTKESNVFIINNNNLAGLIDLNGNLIVKEDYINIGYFSNNKYMVMNEDDKWGIIEGISNDTILELEYSHISDLKGSIARISKNYEYGAINADGEITLDVKYPFFEIENSSIKIKQGNNLSILVFDENGNFNEETEFSNYKTLRINGSQNNNDNITGPNVYVLNDSLKWQKNKTGNWGIYNIKTNKYSISPTYKNFINYPQLDLSIGVQLGNKIGGELPYSGAYPTVNGNLTIISNKIGKPISRPQFVHIFFDDIIIDSLTVARCILIVGNYGLIDKNGKIVLAGMTYIGKFKEGKAICTKNGRLGVDYQRNKKGLTNAGSFFRSIITTLEFEGTNPSIFSNYELVCNDAQWGYIGTDGKWIIDGTKSKFSQVTDFNNNRAIVCQNNKWGIIDENGNMVIPISYDQIDYIPNSEKQLFYLTVYQKKFGCIDSNATVIVPTEFEKVGDFSEGMVSVKKDNLWGFLNAEGKEVIKPEFKKVSDFKEGLAAIYVKGRWGYMDKNGNIIIQPQFSKASDFSEGLAAVRTSKGKTVFIDHSGQIILDLDIRTAGNFENGFSVAQSYKYGWGIIDKNGAWVIKPKSNYKQIENFNKHGLAKIKIGTKGYTLHNKEDKQVTKGLYAQINEFSEGYAVVRRHSYSSKALIKNTNFGFIDSIGKECFVPAFRKLGPIRNGLAVFNDEKGKYGYLKPDGSVVIDPIFFKAVDFYEGKAIVYTSYNKTGIIDVFGNYTINPHFNKIKEIGEDVYLVKAAYDGYYFMDKSQERLNPENYFLAKCFKNGAAPVAVNNGWAVVNKRGLILNTAKYENISEFKSGYAKVNIGKKQGVADATGDIIIQPNYEHVSYAGDGLFRIEKDNQLGYLNSQGEWVWKMED